MINFLHLSALLSLMSALCLQRNAKKMNGANISPSFYSFFIFFSIFVSILLLLPSFSFLYFPFFLSFFLFPILSYPILFFFCYFFFVCSSCLYLCFALSFLVFLFSFLLFCSSFFCSSFFCSSFFCSSFYPFSEECDLQQKFHIDNVKHLPKFYAHFLKARFLFET